MHTMGNFINFFFAMLLAIFALDDATPAIPAPSNSSMDIDFEALLDGSLGTLPALWLVSQGSLLELIDDDEMPAHELLLRDAIQSTSVVWVTVTSTTLAPFISASGSISTLTSPSPSPEKPGPSGRTPKDNGAALVTFLAGMLLPSPASDQQIPAPSPAADSMGRRWRQ
jgi:hypothetical protein